jgi:hypothetical protein
MSGDRSVLPALAKGARYHDRFTYPSGQSVETIDQRNPYHDTIEAGNVAFTFSPEGRRYLARQWRLLGRPLDADLIASLLLYGEEGPLTPERASASDCYVLAERDTPRAAIVHRGPWFLCLSAYTAPVVASRWSQDRQNFVSIWHEKTGLILGGGNTKLQPGWSTFTVGDEKALSHRPGDTNPKFLPQGTLFHVPSAATLSIKPDASLALTYGGETCRVTVTPKDDRSLVYEVQSTHRSGLPVAAHVTILPRLGKPLLTAAGRTAKLGPQRIDLGPAELGGLVRHAGFAIRVPKGASLRWPALPHNPYRADGHAEPQEGRIEIRVPLESDQSARIEVQIE